MQLCAFAIEESRGVFLAEAANPVNRTAEAARTKNKSGLYTWQQANQPT
jgi:hypothetical protein